MVIDTPSRPADHHFVLVLHAIAIATTLGLVWFCAAVVGDIAVRERSLAESVAQNSDPLVELTGYSRSAG